MRMEKRKFRIGELAQHLDVERFVIRFWEKEFNLLAHRSPGGQRYYDEADVKIFKTIKNLLYEKKFTIAGAKKIFKKAAKAKNPDMVIASSLTKLSPDEEQEAKKKEYAQKLFIIRTKLIKIKNLL